MLLEDSQLAHHPWEVRSWSPAWWVKHPPSPGRPTEVRCTRFLSGAETHGRNWARRRGRESVTSKKRFRREKKLCTCPTTVIPSKLSIRSTHLNTTTVCPGYPFKDHVPTWGCTDYWTCNQGGTESSCWLLSVIKATGHNHDFCSYCL